MLPKNICMILGNSCLHFLYSGHTSGFHNTCLSGTAIIRKKHVYFKNRYATGGPYQGYIFFNLDYKFCLPFINIDEEEHQKKLYNCNLYGCVIIFGHWIDFYQMVMPGTVK